jgi:hypothetical protein
MMALGHSSLSNAASTLGWILAHFVWLGLARWILTRGKPGRVWTAALTSLALGLWSISLAQLQNPEETDVNRYFFEGVLVSEAVSPYRTPPARFETQASHLSAQALTALRSIPQAELNFPELGTPYPPIQEATFGAIARSVRAILGDYDRFAFLAGMVIAGLSLVVLGWRKSQVPWAWIALFLCHPLFLREWGVRAHADSLMVGAMLLALSAKTARAQTLFSFLALGLKYPGGWIAWFVESPTLRSRFIRMMGVGLLGAAVSIPFLLQAPPGTSGVAAFTSLWESNSGAHRWARMLFGLYPGDLGELLLRFGLLGLVGGYSAHLVGQKNLGAFEKAALGFQVWILLSPTPNPWYFTWILALLPACRAEVRNPLLLSFLALPLAQGWWAIDWVSTWSSGGWTGAWMRALQDLGVEPLWNFEHAWLGFWTWKAYRSGLRLSHVEQSQR